VDYGVKTTFSARNLLSPEIQGMSRDISRFSRSAKSEFRSMGEVFRGSFLGTFSANVVSSGIGIVEEKIKGAADEFVKLDAAVNQAAIKFGNIEYGSAQFRELETAARNLGQTTSFSAVEAAQGEAALAKANWSAAQTIKIMPSLAEFAEAGNLGLADSAVIAAQALRQFNMNSTDATQQASNWEHLSDVFLASKVNIESASEAVARGGGYLLSTGSSVETVIALEKAFEGVGAGGGMAGIAMKQMVAGLEKLDNKKGAGLLKKLGLNPGEVKLSGDNLIGVLGSVQARYDKLKGGDRIKFLTQLFGPRGANAISLVMNQGIGRVDAFKKSLDGAEGTTKRMGGQIEQSLTERIEKLDKALTEKGFQVFEQVLTGGTGGIEGMVKAIQKFDVRPIASGLQSFGRGVETIAKHSDSIVALAKGFVMIKGVLMATDFLKSGLGMARLIGGFAGAAGGGVGGIGGIGGIGGAVGGGATTGYNPGKIMMWGGGTISTPGTGIPMVTPEKARMTGAQVANGFASAVQALGVGYAIGSVISDLIQDAGNAIVRDQTNRGNDLSQQGVGGEISSLDLSSPAGLLRAHQIMQDLKKKRAATISGTQGIGAGLDSGLSVMAGGDTVYQAAADQVKAIDSLAKMLATRVAEQNKVHVELTVNGDGASKVEVKQTGKSGPNAPRVNVNKAGKQ
jgi:TP901 family phage tail tape measure protein